MAAHFLVGIEGRHPVTGAGCSPGTETAGVVGPVDGVVCCREVEDFRARTGSPAIGVARP